MKDPSEFSIPDLPVETIEILADQNGTAEVLIEQALKNTDLGKLADAVDSYLSAITIYEKRPAEQQKGLSTALHLLSTLYFEQEKFIKAEATCKRALAIREKSLGPRHPEVAESLVLYAKILRQKKFNFKAAQLEARAKDILKKERSE